MSQIEKIPTPELINNGMYVFTQLFINIYESCQTQNQVLKIYEEQDAVFTVRELRI